MCFNLYFISILHIFISSVLVSSHQYLVYSAVSQILEYKVILVTSIALPIYSQYNDV